MERGAQWVYDLHTGPEPPGLGIFEVVRAEGRRRTIANKRGVGADGRPRYAAPRDYELSAEGIRAVGGPFLLRAPVSVGETWPTLGGRTARVVSVSARPTVVAGRFEDCVDVRESGGADGRTVRTVYCPNIGPVLIESSMQARLTGMEAALVARLRSYQP